MVYTYNKSITLHEIEGFLRPSEDPKWLVEYFQSHVQPQKDSIILDIGSGSGVITLLLAQAYPECHIHGIDINTQLIHNAKKNAKINNLTNCTFECVDILKHEFIEQYDHVISNPPYHRQEKGFKSNSCHKNIAHGATLDEMIKWIQKSIEVTASNGTTTILQHTQNLQDLEPVFNKENHHLKFIETSPRKPAKRFILHINKNK